MKILHSLCATILFVSVIHSEEPVTNVEYKQFSPATGDLPDGFVTDVLITSNNTVWVTQIYGLSTRSDQEWKSHKVTYEADSISKLIAGDTPRRAEGWHAVLEDHSGHVWIAGRDGIWKEKDGKITEVTREIRPDYIAVNSKNDIWAATSQEVYRYDGKKWERMFAREAQGLSSNSRLKRLFIDKRDNIWIGSVVSDGGGKDWVSKGEKWILETDAKSQERQGPVTAALYQFDGTRWKAYGEQENLRARTVWPMLEDDKGRILFGTSDGPMWYDQKRFEKMPLPKTVPGSEVTLASLLADGGMVLATQNRIFVIREAVKELRIKNRAMGESIDRFTLHFSCMKVDATGHLWLGTSCNGLINIDPNGK